MGTGARLGLADRTVAEPEAVPVVRPNAPAPRDASVPEQYGRRRVGPVGGHHVWECGPVPPCRARPFHLSHLLRRLNLRPFLRVPRLNSGVCLGQGYEPAYGYHVVFACLRDLEMYVRIPEDDCSRET